MINRLIVLFQIFLIPVYFIFSGTFLYEALYDNLADMFGSQLVFNESTKVLLLGVIIPFLYAFPWVLGSYIYRNRLADSYELMGRALGRVRIDQRLFYGLNALYVLTFFLFPFFSPAFSALFMFFIIKILVSTKTNRDPPPFLWIVPGFFLALVPGVFAFAFYIEYFDLIDSLLEIWASNVDTMYGVGLCLADAVVIGNFYLLIQEGASQVDRRKIPYRQVLIIKFILFGLFLSMYFYAPHDPMYYVNILAACLSGLEALIRLFKKLPKATNSKAGFLLLPIFTAVNFFQNSSLKGLVIFMAAGIFFGLFIFAFFSAKDQSLFNRSNDSSLDF
ncbi:MAG: hypothetical protein ACTSYA_09080 [Candidatus Kariarchaeaceae archaeon]